jgi:REP element-mobilizing transposase RayT
MDDHVHIIVTPSEGWSLSSLLHSWKSYTAHQIQKAGARQAPIWQDECYDRIVRSEGELSAYLRYIRDNPLKRWPGQTNYRWLWVEGVAFP